MKAKEPFIVIRYSYHVRHEDPLKRWLTKINQ